MNVIADRQYDNSKNKEKKWEGMYQRMDEVGEGIWEIRFDLKRLSYKQSHHITSDQIE